MKIEYIRNLQVGHIRMEMDEPLSRMEEEMLSENILEGILKMHFRREDDKYLVYYDITRMRSLDSLLESNVADEKVLKALLTGILVAITQLEKHLLLQDRLCLLPEMIFWDMKTETVHFCYCPEKCGLQEQLIKLMEYILAKTNHKDTGAVKLAYEIYEEVQKPTFCMNDLREYMQKEIGVYKKEEMVFLEEDEDWEEIEEPEDDIQREVKKECYLKRKFWDIKARIMNWIKQRRGRKEKEIEEIALYENGEEEESVTMVLNATQNKIRGMLKYEGMDSLEDIIITETPFIIGSDNKCNGVVKHPNISRFHAKITYQDGIYFMEDLNSTNGTMVNGGLLSYKTRVSLKKGERIYLANEPYSFT